MEPAEFFGPAWAQAVREAVVAGPSPEYRATKLDLYWDWIDMVRATFDGSLALGVTGMPASTDAGGSNEAFVLLRFEAGECVEARPAPRGEAMAATFVLQGTYDDWQAILSGYDTNKAVMYRKLALESGDVYDFFRRVYFFTEILAALARVPARFATVAAV